MINIITLIKILLENDIIKIVLVYYLIGTTLWLLYAIIVSKLGNNIPNHRSCPADNGGRFFCFLAIVFAAIILIISLSYVGFLPYGPDTAGYTYAVKVTSTKGHWPGLGDPYYALYHTSACFLTIMTEAIESLSISYFILLMAFLLSFLLILGREISRIANSKLRCTSIAILALLFLSSPNLRGFDLLQQYVSLVYGAIAIAVLFRLPEDLKSYLLFSTFAAISVITHLSSVLLAVIPLTAAIFYRKRKFTVGAVAFITIAVVYISALATASIPHGKAATATASIPHGKAASALLEKLLYGTPHEFIIRALNEIPTAKIALFSWTLLPSMASAYILLLLARIYISYKERRKHGHSYAVKYLSKLDRFILTSALFSFSFIFLGLLTRMYGIDILRYMEVPSYVMLIFLVSIAVIQILTKNKLVGLFLLLLLLTPYLYSAMYSNERVTWMGGTRLAPVTYTDRVELKPIAILAGSNVRIFSWHDAYVPIEYNNSTLKVGGSYYPIHDLLLRVANGEDVRGIIRQIGMLPYFILSKYIVREGVYKSYNIGYFGLEHILFLPPYSIRN